MFWGWQTPQIVLGDGLGSFHFVIGFCVFGQIGTNENYIDIFWFQNHWYNTLETSRKQSLYVMYSELKERQNVEWHMSYNE